MRCAQAAWWRGARFDAWVSGAYRNGTDDARARDPALLMRHDHDEERLRLRPLRVTCACTVLYPGDSVWHWHGPWDVPERLLQIALARWTSPAGGKKEKEMDRAGCRRRFLRRSGV